LNIDSRFEFKLLKILELSGALTKAYETEAILEDAFGIENRTQISN
jgi:hypothetical protein